MDERIDDVTIVGGGDVGLLTALAVRQLNPGVDVSVVDDFQQAVPQVGKSTYKRIQEILHGTLEIDETRFISEVQPTWKASVYFRDWCDRPEFQFPFDGAAKYPNANTPDALEHYYYHYDELYDSPNHLTRCEQIVAQDKSPWYYDESGDLDRYDNVAYHLDTERFNGFLRELCGERDIELVDDRITAVETTGSRINRVRSDQRAYEADLYVDATGFDRVLRSEQDAEFTEFDFPMDTALTVQIDRSLDDAVPATVVESGDHGWFWQIDTYDKRDLGYVYASEYASETRASAEFLEYVERVSTADSGVATEADLTTYEFTSGYYDRAWVDNCLTVGNAQGFVEPLQSTALTANAYMAVQFSDLLSAHGRLPDEAVRESVNETVRRTWETIRDFVGIHYEYASGDTAFWEDVPAAASSARTERIAEEFDRHGYHWNVDVADPGSLSELKEFLLPDFYTMLRNLGATSEFYEANDFPVSVDVAREREQFYESIREQVDSDHLTASEFYRGVLNH